MKIPVYISFVPSFNFSFLIFSSSLMGSHTYANYLSYEYYSLVRNKIKPTFSISSYSYPWSVYAKRWGWTMNMVGYLCGRQFQEMQSLAMNIYSEACRGCTIYKCVKARLSCIHLCTRKCESDYIIIIQTLKSINKPFQSCFVQYSHTVSWSVVTATCLKLNNS